MNLVNLTEHDIVIAAEGGAVTLPPGEVSARCAEKFVPLWEEDNGVTIGEMEYGPVLGLPEPQKNTLYVVSLLVRQRLPDRDDLVSPVGLLRDKDGRPIACRGLAGNF